MAEFTFGQEFQSLCGRVRKRGKKGEVGDAPAKESLVPRGRVGLSTGGGATSSWGASPFPVGGPLALGFGEADPLAVAYFLSVPGHRAHIRLRSQRAPPQL